MTKDLRLAELLSSRLCHDLIAPISALNTGLELFQENSEEHHTESSEILNLILQSAHSASARLSFFRVAFSSNGKGNSFHEIQNLVKAYFERSKVKVHWDESFQTEGAIEGWGRLLLNCLLWVSECAPRGGEIYMKAPAKDKPSFSLHLKAESVILHQGTVEALQGDAPVQDLTPRTIPCYLIHLIAKEKKAPVSLQQLNSPPELILDLRPSSSL